MKKIIKTGAKQKIKHAKSKQELVSQEK